MQLGIAPVNIATKTLLAIDAAIEADQGNRYRGFLGNVMPHIGDAYRNDEKGHRTHLGASILGQECARAVYYNYRWVKKSEFEGRILRLFNRGHIEEARLIALLLTIGVQVYQQDENGNQLRISFAEGHAGGSGDGVGIGILEAPSEAMLLEFKTHSEKSFISLAGSLEDWRGFLKGKNNFKGQGVRASKFEHYVQSQLYMRKMGLALAIYFAVNKNTDDLYAEILTLNSELADQYLARGEKLVYLTTAPKKIANTPGSYKCRFCGFKNICHNNAPVDLNCRTCKYSTPIENKQWKCTKFDQIIDSDTQLKGCEAWEVNKGLQ